jgi:hypothetical protein
LSEQKDDDEDISAEDIGKFDSQIEKLTEKLKNLKEANVEKINGRQTFEGQRSRACCNNTDYARLRTQKTK